MKNKAGVLGAAAICLGEVKGVKGGVDIVEVVEE